MVKAVKSKADKGKKPLKPPLTPELGRLGQRLRTLRGNKSQEKLTESLELTQKYLSELERGRKTPSWGTLIELAHGAFNVRLSSLLFGIDEDIDSEVHGIEDLLAGRPPEVREAILRAVQGLLQAMDAAHRAALPPAP